MAKASASTKAFETRAQAMGTRMQTVGGGMSRVGAGLSRSVSLPLALAGAASIKLATDFEHSFSQIRALVGASESDIRMYKREVLDLAGATAKAPKELADALYFVTSSGFSGAQALDILRASAKASAAGLGETATVADAVTSAVNAYGPKMLKAERATDILLATVREGKSEPTELAGAIGRVIAPAEAMGVSFDEVGAALAGLSLTGLDAAEATTALRGILGNFMKPSQQTEEALKSLGLTTEGVQSMMEQDFMGTLMKLRRELGDDKVATGELVNEKRALNGFLALTGRNAEKNVGIFDDLARAGGDTAKAFDKAQRDPMFKFNKMLAELQTAGIELGTVLLPVVTDIAREITGLVSSFSDLSPEVQSAIIKWGLLAIAMGPVLRIVGGIVSLGGKAITLLSGIASAGAAASAAPAAAAAARGGVAVGRGIGLAPAAVGRGVAVRGALAGGAAGGAAAGGISAAAIASTAAFAAAVAAAVIAIRNQHKEVDTAAEKVIKYGSGSAQAAGAVEKLTGQHRRGLSDYMTSTLAIVGMGESIEGLDKKHREYINRLTGTTGAVKDFDAVTGRAITLTGRQRTQVATLVGAYRDLVGPLDATTRKQVGNLMAVGDTAGALKLLRSRLDAALDAIDGFKEGNKRSENAMRDTEEAADNLVQRGIKPLGAAVRLTPSHKRINISAPGLNETYGTFRNLAAFLRGIPRSININTTYTQTGVGPRGFKPLPNFKPPARQGGGSVRAGVTYLVGESGPEPFTPSVNGTITPNHKFRSAHEGGGFGGADLEEAIVRAMRRVGNVGPMEVRDNLFLGIEDFEKRTEQTRRRRQILLGARSS